MKFQSAVIALAGTAYAAGNADTVNKVLSAINSDLGAFDQTIKAYTGGSDIAAMTAASDKIEADTKNGAKDIAAGTELSTTDAVSITTSVSNLQTSLDAALGDLKEKGEKLAAAGQCKTIQSQLDSQSVAASALADAITSKTPQELKGVGAQLSGQISASIKTTQDYFKTACANAPSAPAGGSGGKGGSGSGPASGGPSGSSGSPGSPSSGSSTTNGGATPAGGKEGHPKKPAAMTSSPAVYTSAATSFSVPALLCALALAIASL
jgi:hypothetical protein